MSKQTCFNIVLLTVSKIQYSYLMTLMQSLVDFFSISSISNIVCSPNLPYSWLVWGIIKSKTTMTSYIHSCECLATKIGGKMPQLVFQRITSSFPQPTPPPEKELLYVLIFGKTLSKKFHKNQFSGPEAVT